MTKLFTRPHRVVVFQSQDDVADLCEALRYGVRIIQDDVDEVMDLMVERENDEDQTRHDELRMTLHFMSKYLKTMEAYASKLESA